MDLWVQMVLNISKYGGIILAWFFGVVGILATYKEQARKVTRWGWTSILLTTLAAMVGLAGVTAEILRKDQEDADQKKQTLATLHEIRRGQQPLRTIMLDVQAQAPDNDDLDKLVATDMDRYRSRLEIDYDAEAKKQMEQNAQKRQESFRRLEDALHGVSPVLKSPNDLIDGYILSLPLEWRYRFIDPQSPLFPDFSKEFWSHQLLSNLNTTFWFFSGDNPAAASRPLKLAQNDLQFSCYLSNNDAKLRPVLAYDVRKSKAFTLSGKNIVASVDSWASNGKIISVEDLLGARVAVQSATHSAPVTQVGNSPPPVVFKPKLIHFRIVDRDVYLSGEDFTPATADDGTKVFLYQFPEHAEGFAKLRQPPKEPSDDIRPANPTGLLFPLR